MSLLISINLFLLCSVQESKVLLRDWTSTEEFTHVNKRRSNKKGKKDATDTALYYKTQLCWFNDNHPDGCPRMAQTCSFAHGKHELRQPAKKRENHLISKSE